MKSGRTFRAHKALDNLLVMDEYGIEYGIVLSRGNSECDAEGRVLYLPVCLFMFLAESNAFAGDADSDGFRLEPIAV